MSVNVEQGSTEQTAAAAGWWKEPFAVFQTNLQEVDATLDVEATLDFITDYGANTWLLNTGGIVSFYPSKLPFQTVNPLLVDRPSGDLTGDAVRTAHARGVRVLARLDMSKVSSRIAHEHPEWLFVSPTGEPQVYNTLYSTCPNGAYYQERTLDVIDEIMASYPVDGFFFNWFGFSERDYSRVYHGVCHCQRCVAGFAEYSDGQELPAEPADENYLLWAAYSGDVVSVLTAKIAAHVRSRNPSTGLVLGDGAPILYHEANNAFGREFWPQATAENVSSAVNGRTKEAVVVNSVAFVDMPYRMAAEQEESFSQYLLQAISRGARPSTYIMGSPGRIPYGNIVGKPREITRFYGDHKDLYGQITSAAAVGLVRVKLPRYGVEKFDPHVKEFRGLYKSLQEHHVPFDVLATQDLEALGASGDLQRLSLLVLPNVGTLSDGAVQVLDAFVCDGGRLLLIGDSAITAEGGVQLASAPALMRSAPALHDQELWSTYVSLGEQPDTARYRYQPTVLPVYGEYHRLVWRPTAVKEASVLPQAPFGPPEKCYGHGVGEDPGHVCSGDGSVVMVPWSAGRTYHEFGTTNVRDYLVGLVTELAPSRISGSLPEQVDLSAMRAGSDLVLHVINQSGVRRKSVGPWLPIDGAQIRVRGVAGARVRALVADTEWFAESVDGELVVELPRLEEFEVLVIEGAGA